MKTSKVDVTHMMNDRVIYELLYQYLKECYEEDPDTIHGNISPQDIWESFWLESSRLDGRYKEIRYLIVSIVREIDRRDKLKCQYCRIDDGLFVEPPVVPHDLCKKHRQEYEEQYEDRTLKQNHPACGPIIGMDGLSCGPPKRAKYA